MMRRTPHQHELSLAHFQAGLHRPPAGHLPVSRITAVRVESPSRRPLPSIPV
ncbi:MAG TPA: hypothetical protein VGI96_04530 [Streptosporangiaceae bacterium]